ncbi:DUF2793 domain-containing protein [Aquamicrobium segne]|uniref:DUF2793 domain-containing protein n=1 Tax=Aquamicrobium segne TaxID=469547 RepID=A0ABW0GVL8_9HYPH
MEETALLNLPYIMPSQAQKHVTHNEALRMLDAILHISVEDRDRNDPPLDPAEGQRHALGAEPTGSFANHPGAIAVFQDGNWSFHQPHEGWIIWDAAESTLLVFNDEGWKPVFDPQNMPLLGINTTADTLNRLAIAADATLLSHDGADHHLKLNKATATDTGSLLFQTDFSGRAEMGLAGNDDFSIKVSSDGEAWTTALSVDRETGRLGVGVGKPQAVLHTKAPINGQNLLRFDDAEGNSLWRALFDGTNFHHYLSRSLILNLSGTYSFSISGGNGIRGETIQIMTQAADYAAGAKGLRIGENGSGYATAAHPLTKPNMFFRSHAWNGVNGYSFSTGGWFGLEQTAVENGQAKFFWKTGSFASPALMELDHGGNLSTIGSISTAGFAKVGSYLVATLPSASTTGAGAIVFVSDETGGATLAFSDGTDWRRIADKAVVS